MMTDLRANEREKDCHPALMPFVDPRGEDRWHFRLAVLAFVVMLAVVASLLAFLFLTDPGYF